MQQRKKNSELSKDKVLSKIIGSENPLKKLRKFRLKMGVRDYRTLIIIVSVFVYGFALVFFMQGWNVVGAVLIVAGLLFDGYLVFLWKTNTPLLKKVVGRMIGIDQKVGITITPKTPCTEVDLRTKILVQQPCSEGYLCEVQRDRFVHFNAQVLYIPEPNDIYPKYLFAISEEAAGNSIVRYDISNREVSMSTNKDSDIQRTEILIDCELFQINLEVKHNNLPRQVREIKKLVKMLKD